MKVKTDVNGIVRDLSTGALLNTDTSGLQAYKKAKKKNAEIDHLREEVNSMKEQLSQVITLLTKLTENQ